jgi:hypothetical protein
MARYRAKQAFGINFEGENVTVGAGDEVDTDTKAGAALFKQLGKAGQEEHLEPYVGQGQFARPDKKAREVESATSAPGEKRATKK